MAVGTVVDMSNPVFRVDMITTNEVTLTTEKILNFYLQKDKFSVADVLSFTFYGNTNAHIKSVKFYINDVLYFEGFADSKKSVFDEKGRHTTVVCRSKACLLLDNEVEPKVYNNLSSTSLISNFAAGFGFSQSSLPNRTVDNIIARKGMSYWEFIEQFCLQVYQKNPYIVDGNIVLDIFSNKNFKFSNLESTANAINFSSIAISDERYNMISKMHVKTKASGGMVEYGYTLNNAKATGLGVQRERYYNCNEEDYAVFAEKLMQEKQFDYFEIAIETESLLNVNVGDLASAYQDNITYSGLYVAQVKLCGDSSGVKTKVKLWDKSIVY